jgi:hypothetical protein
MDISIIILLAGGVLGLIGYLLKADREAQMQRINTLEQEMSKRPTEAEVRQILDDKIEPLKDSVSDMKASVDRVYYLLIQSKE